MCAAILCLAVCITISDTVNSYFTLKWSSSVCWPVLYHQGSKKSLLRTDIFGTLDTYNANLLHGNNDDIQYFDTVCISDAMNKAGVAKVSDMSLVANLCL